MSTLSNTAERYGSVAKTFHWLTALLILTVFPLGLIANDWPWDTSEALATKAMLFSIHKTLGVTTFFVALLRILWALSQRKPGLLHPDRRLEAFAAETVHWLLYGSLVIVPLSGWIDHAATTGFAPIWWPFGQSLPFVPKSVEVSAAFGAIHEVATKVLLGSFLLHVAGALKHHVIDRDATLRRMLPGRVAISVPAGHDSRAPVAAASVLWAAAIALGAVLGLGQGGDEAPAAPALEAAVSDWTVDSGTLGISVLQFGSTVTGQFADWTAAIAFDPEASGTLGHVTVQVAIASLTIGTVSDQARGADYLDAAGHPVAVFDADILRAGDGYAATGTLSLKGTTLPLTLPFTLELDGATAHAAGEVRLDRRAFGIGLDDEGALGSGVTVSFDLTASRAE